MAGQDKTALVTGATSGLGREVAKALGARGLLVLVHGRDEKRVASVVEEVNRAGGKAEGHVADLASLTAVAALAGRVAAAHPALDVIVNNAGVGAGPPPHRRREESVDNQELRLAVNYLAPVLLTELLLPALRAAAPARVVNIGSVGQSAVDLDDLGFRRDYDGAEAYFRSKFALSAFTVDLAERTRGGDMTVNCVHPATFMDTFQVREAGIQPWVSPTAGVTPVLNLALGEVGGTETGEQFEGTRHSRAHRKVYDAGFRARLSKATNQILAPFASGH